MDRFQYENTRMVGNSSLDYGLNEYLNKLFFVLVAHHGKGNKSKSLKQSSCFHLSFLRLY